jgi:flagellar basal body rod protein FlgG
LHNENFVGVLIMVELVASARVLLGSAERQMEFASHNIANATTIGYKRVTPFPDISGAGEAGAPAIDYAEGATIESGAPLDLKLAGNAFFVVRGPDGWLFTRNGAFKRDSDGLLVTQDGLPVQMTEGDIQLSSDKVAIDADGVIVDGDRALGRLWLVRFDNNTDLKPLGAGLFSAADGAARDIDAVGVRQGALESSNVSSATEMIALMSALRRAETGQRLIQVYDDLMGRTFNLLGQN